MLRTPNKPLQKSNRIVLFYLLLFNITMFMNVVIGIDGQRYTSLGVLAAIWIVDIAIFFTVWRSTSSFIVPSSEVPFYHLLETFDPESLCPFCRVIRLPQSRHCNICNRCVERYDHHCPWVNNCVGRTNHGNFYAHLVLVFAYCIGSSINAVIAIVKGGKETASEEGVSETERKPIPDPFVFASIYTLLAFGIVFGVLVLALVVYQTQNLCQGVTSRERSLKTRLNA